MTAKRRRHKFEKKRKSDEHPHPRRSEEADGRTEGTRGRTGLIPRKREGQAAADESSFEAIVKAINDGKATLRGISIVPEGEGIPGSFIQVGPLNTVDLEEYELGVGTLYVSDQEKELIEQVAEQRRNEKAVRTAGSPDDEASS